MSSQGMKPARLSEQVAAPTLNDEAISEAHSLGKDRLALDDYNATNGLTRRRDTVTLVIPARNEAANIGWVLDEVPACVDEIVLVDGRSTDATLVTARSRRPDVQVVAQQGAGKGDALRAGFLTASGDVIVMIDADGSMSPKEIPHLLYFLSNGYDFVKGSRFMGGGGSLDITRLRRLGNRSLLRLMNVLYDTHLTDLCYGFCAFHRRYLDFLDLTTPGFEIEAQLTICAVRAGLRIAEVPSLELPRRSGQSNLRTFRDGTRVLRTVLREHRDGISGRAVQALRQRIHGVANTWPSCQPGAGVIRHLAARTRDLPAIPIEVDLADSSGGLATTCEQLCAQGVGTALVLGRLHTHPLGVLVLDTSRAKTDSEYMQEVQAVLGEAVEAHLAQDRRATAQSPATGECPAPTTPPCLHRREAMLRQAPQVSVIIATRNRPERLAVCLESLLRLDYPHYEIIVVDNDPGDELTAGLVRTRFGINPQIRYAREPVRGLAAAHNRGIAEAGGQILAFTDDDVIVDSQWLAALVEGFTVASGVGCVTGLILPAALDTPAQLLIELHGGFGKGFVPRVVDHDAYRPVDPLFPFTVGRLGSGANMAFDARLLRQLGGFDPATGAGTFACGGDDLSAFFRVIVRGHRLAYQPSALVRHYHGQELAGVRTQAYRYGVGLGAYLTSALVHEPAMWPALLCRLPAGLAYAFSRSSPHNTGRYVAWPEEYASWPRKLRRLGHRGLFWGPTAYAISRWRTRGVPRRTAALLASQQR